jgi:hypothetical protein
MRFDHSDLLVACYKLSQNNNKNHINLILDEADKLSRKEVEK